MRTIWVKLIHFGYCALFLLTPLLMTNQTSEMFEFPKMLAIYVIAFTVFALWIVDTVTNKRSLRIPPLALAVGAFLVSQMLSTVTSVDIHTSLFGYYGRFNGGLLSTVAYVMLFWVALQTFDQKSFGSILKISVVASIIVLLWGLPGRLLGIDMSCILYRGEWSTVCWTNEFRPHERMFSTLGQPNWLGIYLMMHAFIGIFLWCKKGLLLHSSARKRFVDVLKRLRTKRSIFYGIYVLLMAFGVTLTGSRSSEMGLFGGLVALVLIYLWKRGKKTHVKILALLIALNVIVFGSWYSYRLWMARSDKITHSGTIRLIVWEGALKLAARYPLTGTGPETFAYTYFLTRPEAHNNTTERDLIYNKAHNEFLNFLATTGIVGFAAYVFMLYLMLRTLLHSNEGAILASGILAMSIANFYGFSTSTGQLLLYIIPVYGLLSNHIPESSHRNKAPIWLKGAMVVVVLGGWLGMMRYFYQYLRADLAYARATSLQYSSAYIESIDAFTQALGYRFEHIYADKFALIVAQTAYLLSEADTEKVYGEQVQSYIKMAENIQTAAVQSSPHNPMYWKDRVRMFRLVEDVVPEKDKKDVALQIKTAISQATKLAPTDLEVREMATSKQ
ncbi:O-antigen ligase family protein [Candidatus Woesebacteria bacterium]|nr:O-antigen ligase family protein [Candidatus Woesebacteria bacterium]